MPRLTNGEHTVTTSSAREAVTLRARGYRVVDEPVVVGEIRCDLVVPDFDDVDPVNIPDPDTDQA